MSAESTRRGAIRMALMLGVALAVPTAMSAPADAHEWDELHRGFAWFNPNVAACFRRARAAGMRPGDLASVNFPNRDSTFVTFYMREDDALRSFDVNGERGWHS